MKSLVLLTGFVSTSSCFQRLGIALTAAMILVACGEGPPVYTVGTGGESPAVNGQTQLPSPQKASSASASVVDSDSESDAEGQDEADKEKDMEAQMLPSQTGANVTTPTPPPAQKLALRTLPNAAERTAMSNLYAATPAQGGCAQCHGALANSAKKGRTAAQLSGAMNMAQHNNVRAANKWPRDVADTTDDGVDSAQLLASALAELLK